MVSFESLPINMLDLNHDSDPMAKGCKDFSIKFRHLPVS
jgi:hypothetical protein